MRKLFPIALAAVWLASAADQRLSPVLMGWHPNSPNASSSTVAINGASKWAAFGFAPDAARTLNSFTFYVSAATGAPVASASVSCELYSDNGGQPGATTGSSVPLSSNITGAGWYTCSGFSNAVAADTQYWIVVKCPACDGSKNFTIRFGGASTGVAPGQGGSPSFAWAKKETTDGSTWTAAIYGGTGWRVGYSDGYAGFPVDGTGNGLASADLIYGTRETGVVFTAPSGAALKVGGIAIFAIKVGSPTSGLRFRLYTGSAPSPIATTNTIAAGNVTATGYYVVAHFPSVQTLAPGTVVRVVAGAAGGTSDASNYYTTIVNTVHNDAASKALMPFGSLKKTHADAPPAFGDDDTKIVPFALVLDGGAPFSAAQQGGGGGAYVWVK